MCMTQHVTIRRRIESKLRCLSGLEWLLYTSTRKQGACEHNVVIYAKLKHSMHLMILNYQWASVGATQTILQSESFVQVD